MKFELIFLSFSIASSVGYFISNNAILKILNDKSLSNEHLQEFRKLIQSTMDKYEASISDDPDLNRNVTELIKSKGYPVEEHHVQTKDGYILGIQRIPKGINEKSTNNPKPAIYLHHGLKSSAVQWVMDFPHQSLGYILADAGYDVWLGNARGNSYSDKHIKYTTKDKEFWQFSMDELALLDFPAAVDYILNITGQTQISYVGHSMGCTIGLAMLSDLPEYNNKINAFIALAPSANLTYITSPVRFLAPFAHDLEFLLNMMGEYEFKASGPLMHFLTDIVCGPKHFRATCENILFLMMGTESNQLNETRLPVYLHKFPDAVSTLEVIHYAQLINDKQFQKFDYGTKENMIRYGQETPPIYQVDKITTPIAIYYALNDVFADPVDVANLKPHIKNLLEFYQVPYPAWTHFDFAIGLDANKYVYPNVLSILKSLG